MKKKETGREGFSIKKNMKNKDTRNEKNELN